MDCGIGWDRTRSGDVRGEERIKEHRSVSRGVVGILLRFLSLLFLQVLVGVVVLAVVLPLPLLLLLLLTVPLTVPLREDR